MLLRKPVPNSQRLIYTYESDRYIHQPINFFYGFLQVWIFMICLISHKGTGGGTTTTSPLSSFRSEEACGAHRSNRRPLGLEIGRREKKKKTEKSSTTVFLHSFDHKTKVFCNVIEIVICKLFFFFFG